MMSAGGGGEGDPGDHEGGDGDVEGDGAGEDGEAGGGGGDGDGDDEVLNKTTSSRGKVCWYTMPAFVRLIKFWIFLGIHSLI